MTARKKVPGVRSANETDQLLGQRIRARRLEMEMSQQGLAEHLGVSFQQVQKYEKGVNRVGSTRLVEIARVLETDVDYFMGDMMGKKKPVVSRFSTFLATKHGADIMDAMLKLENHNERQFVIDMARKLVALHEGT
jgi:transcriptional regulator with XRE-family HTH domain